MFIETISTTLRTSDPLEAVESYADRADIPCDRIDDGEIHLSIGGAWRDVLLWFVWRPDFRTIQIGAALDLKASPPKADAVSRLIALVNENLWIGHFDLWSEDGSIVYRHGVVLPEGAAFDQSQVEILIRNAVQAYERFYPAFNYVIWSGDSPQDAMTAAMFETAGSA